MIVSRRKISSVMEYLFSVEDIDFFSSTFSRRKAVKDLLSIRYTSERGKRERRCYEGVSFSNHEIKNKILKDSIFIDLKVRKHNLRKDDVLLYYREKIRKNRWLCVTYENEMLIGEQYYRIMEIQKGQQKKEDGSVDVKLLVQDGDNNVLYLDPDTFDISVPPYIYDFIEELLYLNKYEFNHLFSSPVCRSSFHERENYFKFLAIFFVVKGGFNTKQIFHTINIARVFGFSSKTTEKIFVKVLSLNLDESENVLKQLLSQISHTDILGIDVSYLISISGYSDLIKYELLKEYSDMADVPFEKLLYIFETIKKNIQGEETKKDE